MQTSFETVFLEFGLSTTPLEDAYNKYSTLCTHSWLRAIWEQCWRFEITLWIKPPIGILPRLGDQFFVQAALQCNLLPKELFTINHICIHQQVLYLSDIMSANGKSIPYNPVYKHHQKDIHVELLMSVGLRNVKRK